MKSLNELGFITNGEYAPYPPLNSIFQMDDLIPLIVNNKTKIIGEGRFSNVYLYKHKNNGKLFALKQISVQKIIESGNDINIIQREMNIHSRINHENIVKFYSYNNKDLNHVNILLEYCPNGAIFELINKNGFDEFQTYKYFSQVVNAVYFLHKNNLVHRDIKPENILLNGDKIKLCDFGWCCETDSNNRKSFCGTFEYMAPEIINEIPYGKPVDIWALGILLYELYYGISPFNSNKQNEEQTKEIINNIMQNKLFFDRKSIAYDMKDLIIHMLDNDVKRRYTIDEVVSHPWFKKCKNKIKDIDLIQINKINNINFDNLETNVTKVTKIIKEPIETYFNLKNILYNNKTFSNNARSNKNNYDQNSNNFLNFNKSKNIDINPDEKEFINDNNDDGFSPFMKNGSINISVSLTNNNNINNILQKSYSFKQEMMNSNNFFNLNSINRSNIYPKNTQQNDIKKGEIKYNNKNMSSFMNTSRISIVKLGNEDKNLLQRNFSIKPNSYYNRNNVNNNNKFINYNFYQINNNNQFNNIFY